MKSVRPKFFLAAVTLLGLVMSLLSNVPPVEAAFGTSPPWVRNDHMLPGTTFEQVINLSRSEMEDAMKATVKITGDKKLLEWVSIENENDLIMKKGQNILPMKVIVKVPERAEIRNYKGGIYVTLSRVATDSSLSGGEVAITLGANISVDITVIGEKVTDYRVKAVFADPLTEGEPFSIKMEVENLGNTEISQFEGKIDIYDSRQTNVIKSLDFIPVTTPISPDETSMRRMVFTDLMLESGEYWVNVQVLKNGQVEYENKLLLEVREKVVPVVTPEDALSEKPALPKTSVETNADKTGSAETPVTSPIIVQIPASELKPAASETSKLYLVVGLAGFGLGLIAIIGIIVVLIMVLKNQQRSVMNQLPVQGLPPEKAQDIHPEEKK